MSDDSAKISPTAYFTAQIWADLGFPHADLFATRRGRFFVSAYHLLGRLTGRPGDRALLTRTLINRHTTLDDAVLALRPDRVIELGAGLSPRSIALAADHDIDCIDIDLPAMLARKQSLFARHATPALTAAIARRWRAETLDVTSPIFADRLHTLLEGSTNPVIVAEGLIGYFDDPTKHQIISAVHRALAGRGAFLADVRIVGRDPEATRTLRLGIRIITRNRGASPGFQDESAALELWRSAGFTHAELLPLRDTAAPPVLSRILLSRP